MLHTVVNTVYNSKYYILQLCLKAELVIYGSNEQKKSIADFVF